MKLQNIVVTTRVAKSGMTVREVFRECVERNVPGIPYQDHHGRITGRVSVRHTLKVTCMPDYMVAHAHLLGDEVQCLIIPEARALKVLESRVDAFVLERMATINSQSPVVKALAIMEELGTGYIFVLDGEEYRGVVTRLGIAKRMLELKA